MQIKLMDMAIYMAEYQACLIYMCNTLFSILSRVHLYVIIVASEYCVINCYFSEKIPSINTLLFI